MKKILLVVCCIFLVGNVSAMNNSIYFSTDSSKLCYKDSSGATHDLY